jgi:transglutaminase-like enzyme
MQLPHSEIRQKYIDQVKIVETNLKEATSGEIDKQLLVMVQKRLDTLADKYQNNEGIGRARYKLYELQALIHYFNEHDDDALDFINQAIETRGEVYPKAEKLKKRLSLGDSYLSKTVNPDKMTKVQRRSQKIGLEGWLAFFIVGVGLGILLGIINLLGYGSVFNDLASVQSATPGYVAAMTPVLWFEILTNLLSIGIAIWLLILLAKHRKIAKRVAIIYLILNAVLLVIDYAWAASVFDTYNVTQYVQTEMSKTSRDVARGVGAAFIWIPYFLISKRVKRTLTK